MNQTASANTHPVDFETLRQQLEEDGRAYCVDQDSDYKKGRQRLLHTLQTNDCREVITAAVDCDDLADAFVFAGLRKHVDILEALLYHGMNIDIKDFIGWTALREASANDCEECVRFLLDHNANVDAQDTFGGTALIWASVNGHAKIVEMLLEKNANPDHQDNAGRTALMLSSSRGHKEIVQVLLNHGADIELKNKDGETALDVAEDEDIKEMIRNHVPTSYVLK